MEIGNTEEAREDDRNLSQKIDDLYAIIEKGKGKGAGRFPSVAGGYQDHYGKWNNRSPKGPGKGDTTRPVPLLQRQPGKQ